MDIEYFYYLDVQEHTENDKDLSDKYMRQYMQIFETMLWMVSYAWNRSIIPSLRYDGLCPAFRKYISSILTLNIIF